MVTQLSIEDSFKLYYVDGDGDTMLVSAHTALRDLIYSEQITAKVDDCLATPLPDPTPSCKKTKKTSSSSSATSTIAAGDDGSGVGGGKKKKKQQGSRAVATADWDGV